MPSCCDPRGCDQRFTERFARRTAARYRSHGLDKTASAMVSLLEQRGLSGATVLEIGGGVGGIQIELLKRGAASAVNVELSGGYETQAQQLLAEAGLTGRMQRRLVDLAQDQAAVAAADIVVLHRVVCCYPDYAALLATAAEHTDRHLVFSYPPRNLVSRAVTATENLASRVRGRDFRTFVHPPQAMLAVLSDHGLQPAVVRRGRAWHVAAATR